MNRTLLLIASFGAMVSIASAQNVPGEHFIENWDMNGDGIVSVDDAREKRGDVFVMFDADENGVLDASEYKLFDETRAEDMRNNGDNPGGKHMMRAQAGLIMEFNDVDDDGTVTKAEFVGKTEDWLAMLDRSGDGQVDGTDFGPRN